MIKQTEKLILISKEHSQNNYRNWLLSMNPSLKIANCWGQTKSIKNLLDKASGIIISGGNDIAPSLYDKTEEEKRCRNVDPERDTLELVMIDYAIKHKIPLLGICRGLQLINIFFGGSLIVDIETDLNTSVIHCDEKDVWHDVSIKNDSYLYQITHCEKELVNSSHHQAIDELGEGLVATAFSDDQIIEAIEHKNKSLLPFFMAVEWHPERMNHSNPMSKNIGEKFIQSLLI